MSWPPRGSGLSVKDIRCACAAVASAHCISAQVASTRVWYELEQLDVEPDNSAVPSASLNLAIESIRLLNPSAMT